MTGMEPKHLQPGEAGTESRDAQSSLVGGVWGDQRLSVSRMADANEGSRNARRPWLWALGWVGGLVVIITALILILR